MPEARNTRRTTRSEVKDTPKNQRHKGISNLAQLSSKNPIPFEGGMGFSMSDASKYLPFLSNDDNYGVLLLESRLLSSTHNACIVTKKDYCAGSGLGFRYSDGSEIDPDLNEYLKSVNLKDESALEINKKIYESLFTWGNVPIEIVRFTVAGKRYFYIYVHNFLEWRLGLPDDDDDIVHYAIQSKLFTKNKILLRAEDIKKAKKLPIYNPKFKDEAKTKVTKGYNWVKDEKGVERTLIWYKNSIAGFDHYGLPSAVAGLIYQILEYKGARYNLDNFENNMVVSAILTLRGAVSEAEANAIGRKALNLHTGDGKRGRVMVAASEAGIDGSDLHNLDTHKEGSFKESDLLWSEKIILANQWDSVLAGLVSPSSLGKGTGFITKILETKKNTVIRPLQKDLVTKVWGKIFKLLSEWMPEMGKIKVENLEIDDTVDISGLTDVDITPVVTADEVRGAKGLPNLEDKEKGKMLLGELGNEQKKGVYVKDTSNKSEPTTN